jgi:hypothetical protein
MRGGAYVEGGSPHCEGREGEDIILEHVKEAYAFDHGPWD